VPFLTSVPPPPPPVFGRPGDNHPHTLPIPFVGLLPGSKNDVFETYVNYALSGELDHEKKVELSHSLDRALVTPLTHPLAREKRGQLDAQMRGRLDGSLDGSYRDSLREPLRRRRKRNDPRVSGRPTRLYYWRKRKVDVALQDSLFMRFPDMITNIIALKLVFVNSTLTTGGHFATIRAAQKNLSTRSRQLLKWRPGPRKQAGAAGVWKWKRGAGSCMPQGMLIMFGKCRTPL
jgi:hypothetical protein